MSSPAFWSAPFKYCRWAARERPAIFWSVMIGAAGPVAMPIVPPIRKYFGDVDPAPIPVTYPGKGSPKLGSSFPVHARRAELTLVAVPTGSRKQLSGYDD
ncbi:hypothetical protein AAL_07708 [Moelleriella libera RCEF 2490]|uniref:NADH-ubiquinone oxidoreductase 9.5 kDa subunit n=1 Tax=Moelleriella libera RCEF 2490 TaxID=1081109 RepID=A0A167WY34_9HYPO|nr:hypothetical protein AAL_07708 [Moelleriella libera RCEF 2490]